MAGNEHGGGSNEYAFEGYPVSEVRTRYGVNPYRLAQYEHHSIGEVKSMLAKPKGYSDRETIEQHLAYMESLAKKLNMILSSEEREGIMNLELRQSLSDIRNCCLELTKKIEQVRHFSY